MKTMQRVINTVWRWLIALSRPSGRANARRLRARGVPLDGFRIREATVADISALIDIHVVEWNRTYAPMLSRGPSHAVRERQWRAAFAEQHDGSARWFCFVCEGADGEVVGFAQANVSDNPAYGGELRKVYLRRDYQRLGIGRRLVGHVARRFLAHGITSMWLYGDARNPSQATWRALGAHRTDDDPSSGNYGWHDIRPLAELPE